jgi:hypothetical protein
VQSIIPVARPDTPVAVTETKHIVSQNNHNNINNQTNIGNQNNIVVFNFDNEPLPLHYDHLTKQMIQQLFNNTHPIEGIRNYAHKVLERPENMCVKKTNMRAGHSYVHAGDNKWKPRVDADVYPRLTYNISSNLLEYVEATQRKLQFSNRLRDILNDVVSENNPHYKDVLKRIKMIVFELSESLLSINTTRSGEVQDT